MPKRKRTPAQRRALEGAQTRAAKTDQREHRHDEGHGTSPASLGAVKAASEESRLATCSECGYSGGRHARVCPKRPAA